MQTIIFPKEEIDEIKKRLSQNKPIFTIRVSSEFNKYSKGEKLNTEWGDLIQVKEISKIKNIREYSYLNELTKSQIEILKKYKKINVLKLIPVKQSQKIVWEKIASEWQEFKKRQDPNVVEFVKKAKGKLLDIGCGSGRNFTKTKAEIYSVDFSPTMLKYAEKNAKILKIKAKFFELDITKTLPFEDNFFDSAIAIAALHCIEGKNNRQKMLKEIFRILKPKAQLMLKTWNRKSKRFKGKTEKLVKWRDKGTRYYYLYEEKELENELKKAGFKIISIISTNELNFELQEISVIAEKN